MIVVFCFQYGKEVFLVRLQLHSVVLIMSEQIQTVGRSDSFLKCSNKEISY